MNEKEQSQGQNRMDIKILRTCGCSTIQNYVAKYSSRLNEQLEKEGVLLPTTSPRNATSLELAVLCHQIEEDIVSSNIDTGRIRFSHRPNGKGGWRQPWVAPHQQLNAKLQYLHMSATWHAISILEIRDACIKKNNGNDKVGTTYCP